MARIVRICAIAILSALFLSAFACDGWAEIEFFNETESEISVVVHRFGGEQQIGRTIYSDNCNPCDIASGMSAANSEVHDDPISTDNPEYAIFAFDTALKEVLFSAVYSWDDLEDMDWKVTITDMRQ